ncbi:MAG TPA: hypothetical protein VFJ70_05255 [Burkholderiales bacterium]|nr:hypothetical protein [Burkholderiales bacterium]
MSASALPEVAVGDDTDGLPVFRPAYGDKERADVVLAHQRGGALQARRALSGDDIARADVCDLHGVRR